MDCNMNITINDVVITDQKLSEIWRLVRKFSNDENYELEPSNEDFYNIKVLIKRNLQAKITPRITIKEGGGSRILDLEFQFEDGSDKATVILSGCHFSIKGLEYPKDIVKALKISLQTGNEGMANFLVGVFGKAIISKDEIENVFGRSQFGFVKQELSSDENVRFLYLDNINYVIMMNKIGTTLTFVGDGRKMKKEYRDMKELPEILDKIDTPEKAYGKGIEVCNNANNKHELEFFKKIHDNYSRLLRKEKEVNEKKLNISTVAFLLPALALFFAVFFIEINKTELWNFLSLCLLMPTLYFIVLFLVIALFKSKDNEILLVSMVQGSRLLLIIWAITGMLLTYYDILPFLILLSLTIYYASVVVYYKKRPAYFDRNTYPEIHFIYITPAFLAAIFGTFYSARSQTIIQYALLLSVAGSLLFSSFYLMWMNMKNGNIENGYKIIQKIFEKIECKTDEEIEKIELSLSNDLHPMKEKTAEKWVDEIGRRVGDKKDKKWRLSERIECSLLR